MHPETNTPRPSGGMTGGFLSGTIDSRGREKAERENDALEAPGDYRARRK